MTASKYLILLDSEGDEKSATWRSVSQMRHTLIDSSNITSRPDLELFFLDSSKPVDCITALKERLDSLDENHSETFLIYFTSKFPLLKITREKWLRERDYKHVIFVMGGLFTNPNMTVATFAPLKNKKSILVYPFDLIEKHSVKAFEQSSSLSFPLPVKNIPFEKKIFNERGKRKFCYGGRLSESKGIFELILSFQKLVKLFPHAELHVAGFDHNRSYPMHGEFNNIKKVHELINKAKSIPNFHFHGDLPFADWISLLKDCDSLVYPTTAYEEDFALSVIQAKLAGLTIIGSRWSVLKEITDQEDFLVNVEFVNAKAQVDSKALLDRMIEFQNKEKIEQSNFSKVIFENDWINVLISKIEKSSFGEIEFSEKYLKYRDLFLEHGHAPFEDGDQNPITSDLHQYFFKDFL